MESFDAETQMSNLGIEEIVGELVGKRVLDIGCGAYFNLIESLREKGINAEGIDPKIVSSKEYLIKKNVRGKGIEKGIPRENESYDYVFVHQNPFLNESYGPVAKTDFLKFILRDKSARRVEQHQKLVEHRARTILYELSRVLKTRGRGVVYPAILHAQEFIDTELSRLGVKAHLEEVVVTDSELLTIWHNPGIMGGITEDVSEFALRRTVFTKE